MSYEIIALRTSAKNHAGKTCNRLTAIAPVGRLRNNIQWLCLCSCGNEVLVNSRAFSKGRVKSCGCLKKEKDIEKILEQSNKKRTHGKSGKNITGEYRCWKGMNSRCFNSNATGYKNYGGRGISVCSRWRYSFEKFLEDMKKRPSIHLSIDRINNDGDYEPGNCRWTTRSEQMKNTRLRKRDLNGRFT